STGVVLSIFRHTAQLSPSPKVQCRQASSAVMVTRGGGTGLPASLSACGITAARSKAAEEGIKDLLCGESEVKRRDSTACAAESAGPAFCDGPAGRPGEDARLPRCRAPHRESADPRRHGADVVRANPAWGESPAWLRLMEKKVLAASGLAIKSILE